MQRAENTVSCASPGPGPASRAWPVQLLCSLVLALAGTVAGRPTPVPAATDGSTIVIGLWQTVASAVGLPPGMELPLAGYGGPGDDPNRPYRRTRLHHFTLPCESCHDTTPVAAADISGAPDTAKLSTDTINRSCTSGGCHDYDRTLNHPLDVEVAAADRLPFYAPPEHANRINCLTCHMEQPAPVPAAEDDSGLLTVPDGDDLCVTCHMQEGNDGRIPGHWRFSDKAHLRPINPGRRFTSQTSVSVARIDTESMTCVSCHDEITVTVPQEHETYRQRMIRWSRMADHAIGMRYSAIVARQRGQFNYPLPDTDRIRLFDGRVGCGSCHSLYASNPAYVVTRQNNGTLCRKCHIK